MKKIQIDEFLSLLKYTPKTIGKELYDSVRYIDFRIANCHSPSMEFCSKIDVKNGGQPFYFEVIDFRNYDTRIGEIISENRRHGVINTYLNRKNMHDVAKQINEILKNVYHRKGPVWK